MTPESRKHWQLVMAVGCIVFAVILCLFLFGCDSLKPVQTADLADAIKPVHESVTKMQETVQGNSNQLQNITDNSQVTNTEIKKILTQIQISNQKSSSAQAESIGKLSQHIDNSSNSSWMVFGIMVASMLINALLVMGILKIKVKVTRAISSPDNSLTSEQFKRY